MDEKTRTALNKAPFLATRGTCNMLKVAILSNWHVHAKDYAKEATERNDIEIVAIWDEVSERGREFARQWNAPFVEDLENGIFHNEEIDAVIVTTPTSMHREVISKAMAQKKHVFSEKVLALTNEDCEYLVKLARDKGVQLMLSLPRLSESPYLTVQHLLDQGVIGDLTHIRCRVAHDGALPRALGQSGWLKEEFFEARPTGGGALIDLGAHPIYLTNRLAGKALSVSATFSYLTKHDVEDHAIVTVKYASGATGVLETGFVSKAGPFELELYGTLGTILAVDNSVRLRHGAQVKRTRMIGKMLRFYLGICRLWSNGLRQLREYRLLGSLIRICLC